MDPAEDRRSWPRCQQSPMAPMVAQLFVSGESSGHAGSPVAHGYVHSSGLPGCARCGMAESGHDLSTTSELACGLDP